MSAKREKSSASFARGADEDVRAPSIGDRLTSRVTVVFLFTPGFSQVIARRRGVWPDGKPTKTVSA